jgi:hypothetical protein
MHTCPNQRSFGSLERDLNQNQHEFQKFQVFDAALQAVSTALAVILPFLLPGSLVMTIPGMFMDTSPLDQRIMVVAARDCR